MGLLAGRKWCISGNPGNTLSGHHLSVGNPSVCSQGIPCQVYGLECWGWAVEAATADIFKSHQLATSHKRSIGSLGTIKTSKIFNDNSPTKPRWATRVIAVDNYCYKCFKEPAAKTGSRIYAGRKRLKFRCQKVGPKPDPDPRPPDLHQNVRNNIANTPGKLLAPEGSF